MKKRSIGDIELAYMDRGSGPPVFLVHGFPMDHSLWNAQIDELAGDYRVIAPDLRGFGHSGASKTTVSMAQFADDLVALLDALCISEPIVLCGLSMGGYIAFEFLRKYGGRLRGLILCDTRAACDTPSAAANRLETAERVLREGVGPLVDNMIGKLFSPKTFERRPEVAAAMRETMMSQKPSGVAAALWGMASRRDSRPLLPEIRCPTLVVVGRDDGLSTPEEMRSLASAIAGARFFEIADSGHLSPLEGSEQFNAIVRDFLARGLSQFSRSGTAAKPWST
jgi:3-oxoadipate enol-lactonase